MSTPITKVIFRRDRTQSCDVFAFFPCEASTCRRPELCTVFQHVGQHSAGDPGIMIRQSRPATPAEYADLAAELRGRGYRLQVIHRTPSDAYTFRAATLNRKTA